MFKKIKVALLINRIDKLTKKFVLPTQRPVTDTLNFIYTLLGDVKSLLNSLNKEFTSEFSVIADAVIKYANEFNREIKHLDSLSNPKPSYTIRSQAKLLLGMAELMEILESMATSVNKRKWITWLHTSLEEPYQQRAEVVGESWAHYLKSIKPVRTAKEETASHATSDTTRSDTTTETRKPIY